MQFYRCVWLKGRSHILSKEIHQERTLWWESETKLPGILAQPLAHFETIIPWKMTISGLFSAALSCQNLEQKILIIFFSERLSLS